MIIDPNIDYTNIVKVLDLLDKLDDTVRDVGLKKSFIAKQVGENPSTYAKLISFVDGYVSEERIRKYCDYLNKHYE